MTTTTEAKTTSAFSPNANKVNIGNDDDDDDNNDKDNDDVEDTDNDDDIFFTKIPNE